MSSGSDHRGLQARLAIVVLAVIGPAARAADTLPRPPEGKAWKLAWRGEFVVDYVRVYDLVEHEPSGAPAGE